MVDAVNQMVRHIKQSTPALTACLRDKSIRRAVIALIKLFVELSTQQYLGPGIELAQWLVEPIKKMFTYACENFSVLFSKNERE